MRQVMLLGAAGLGILVAGCGSDSPTASATASSAPPGSQSPGAGLDPCLVGAWRSTGTTGSLTIGGAKVPVSGGSGEALTITADGVINTDETSTSPVTGTAADGTQYVLRQSGTAKGRVSGSSGRISVELLQPTSLTVTLLKNGTVVQSQHPGSASDTYQCTHGSSLVITGGGGTVTAYSAA